MPDPTVSGDMANQPGLLLSAEDYERLMELARAAAARDRADDTQLLLGELHRADVVPPEWMPQGVVTMNAHVEFRNDCTGAIRRVQLVYPHDANIGLGRVSVLSSVGVALLGLAEGQSIRWFAGGRRRGLTVLRVSDQPFEAAEEPRA